MDVDTIARDVILAASLEEPAAEQPLSPVQLSPDTWQRARTILAIRRRPLPVGNPHSCERPAARRRFDLDDPPSGHDPWVYPPESQQDTQQERNEKADANWRRTLPQRQSQRLASAQRHDAMREVPEAVPTALATPMQPQTSSSGSFAT